MFSLYPHVLKGRFYVEIAQEMLITPPSENVGSSSICKRIALLNSRRPPKLRLAAVYSAGVSGATLVFKCIGRNNPNR